MHAQALSISFGVLAYNAFASSETKASYSATGTSIKQRARRMTISAKDLAYRMKNKDV